MKVQGERWREFWEKESLNYNLKRKIQAYLTLEFEELINKLSSSLKEGGIIMPKVAKFLIVIAVSGFLIAGVGCGPKKATKESLSKIEELQSAIKSAKTKKSELESKISKLEEELKGKDVKISKLEHERDSLRNWLDILEKGY